MKKTKGFYLIEIVVAMTIVLLSINIGGIFLRNQQEKKELREAKVEIYEMFSTLGVRARQSEENYSLEFDYIKKEIRIKNNFKEIINTIYLPKTLKYTTIFNKLANSYFEAQITHNGNITPSFTIYIFDYNNIAQYRISLYGFQLIKYIKINVYKNIGDTTARYNNIEFFHKNWTTENKKWKEE